MKLRKARQHRRGANRDHPDDRRDVLSARHFHACVSVHAEFAFLPVNLPQGHAGPMQPKTPVTLTITSDSNIFLDKTQVTLDTLALTLKPMLEGPEAIFICGCRHYRALRRNRQRDDAGPRSRCAAFPYSCKTC